MTGLTGAPSTKIADNTPRSFYRFNGDGSLATGDTRGRYYEQTSRLKVFSASNAATSQSLATLLSTTAVGLIISNPVGSGYNLEILNFTVASTGTASGAVGGIGIQGGGSSAGVVTHTTPLAALWGPNLLGPAPGATASAGVCAGSVASVDSAATTVGSPRVVRYTASGLFTTVPPNLVAIDDVAGAIVVAPGGFVATVALIASMTNLLSAFTWAENPA